MFLLMRGQSTPPIPGDLLPHVAPSSHFPERILLNDFSILYCLNNLFGDAGNILDAELFAGMFIVF